MKPDVYYFTARTHSHEESMSKFKGPLALEKLRIEDKIKNDVKIVVKSHFGALENTRYLRPSYLRFLCDYVKELGGIPSVAESCGWGAPESFSGIHTEYSGRATETEYLEVALKHGFTKETMGSPIIMLDGENGTDYEIQKIDGKLFKEVLVAGRLREFDYMVVASHFKGHSGAGFGGAIKNLGIGCVSKGGKVRAHTGPEFDIDFNSCNPECVNCLKICPTSALTKDKDGKLNFNEDLCKLCFMCASTSLCKEKVFNLGTSTREEFITQFVDNAKGVVDYFGKDKIFYINYAIDITYQCDCTGGSDIPFVPDIGVLASIDPVAIDQATVDLVHQSSINPHSILSEIKDIPTQGPFEWFSYIPRFSAEGLDLNHDGIESKHWELQLIAAEEIGLGTRDYNLIEVKIEKEKSE